LILALAISQSYEKTNQFLQAIQFITSHVMELSHINSLHTLHMLAALQLMTTKSVQRKPNMIVTVTQQQEESSDLFRDPHLFEIALTALSTSAHGSLSDEDEASLVIVMSNVLEHLTALRGELFDKTKPSYLCSTGYLEILRNTMQIFAHFLTSTTPETCSPSRYFLHLTALRVLSCLIELWFIDPSISFDSIGSELEQGIQLGNWLKRFPPPTDDTTSSLSPPSQPLLSLENILAFFYSAQILENLTLKKLRVCYKLSSLCAFQWREIINTHSAMTSSRTTTLNAPGSLPPAISSIQLKSQANLCHTLMMMICATIGCLVNYCGEAVNHMTVTEILYLTQYAYRALNSLKFSFSSAATSSFVIPAVLTQLLPLAKIKSLEYVGQVESALHTAADIGILNSLESGDAESDPYQLLSRKKRIPTSNPQRKFEINLSYAQRVFNGSGSGSCHLAQWQLISLLSSLGYHSETESFLERHLSLNVSISFLTSERIWNRFLGELKKISPPLAQEDDVLCQYLCRRDLLLPPDLISSLELAMQSLLSSNESDLQEIEVSVRYRLGVIQWAGGSQWRADKTKCLGVFLGAAKLDPNYGKLYTYLGHYYSLVMHDPSRATKCYIKALTFDPMEAEAGVCLSLLRLNANDLAAAKKLWSDIATLTASHARWCYGMSGKVHLALEEYEEAILAFQKSLELEECDILAWFGLGVSYLSLTQHTAAMKSLQFALSLLSLESPPSSPTPPALYVTVLITLAEVERRLCHLPESLAHYQEACDLTSHQNILALKGFGDVCLALAYERFTMGWTSGCGEIIQKGLEATETLKQLYRQPAGSSSASVPLCIHKLRGDLFTFCRHLGPDDLHSSAKCHQEKSDSERWSHQALLTSLQQGEVEYQIHLGQCQDRYLPGDEGKDRSPAEEDGELVVDNEMLVSSFYDLGCAYYYRAIATLTALGQGTGVLPTTLLLNQRFGHFPETPNELLQTAMKKFLEGLRVSHVPHSGCWNGIGLCVQQDDSLREACFILATQIEPNVAAYANLSLLLIHHNLRSSAKECLSELQLIESNPLHWLSLGALLEKESPHSAVDQTQSADWAIRIYDAYIAAVEVAKPADALLGIALAWLRVKGLLSPDALLSSSFNLLNTNRVSAIEVRHQVENRLCQFLHRRPVHPLAWSLLGWCYQYRSNWSKAIESYRQSLLSINHILKHCDEFAPLPEQTLSSCSLLSKFDLHHLSLCHTMLSLQSNDPAGVPASRSPLSSLLSSVDLSELSRCLPAISLSPDDLDSLAETLSHSYRASEIRSSILESITVPPVKHDLILLCSRLSQDTNTSAVTRQSYADILVSVGSLAVKGLPSNENSTGDEKNALIALRQHSDSALAVLEAISDSKHSPEESSLLLGDLSAFHHRHPRLLLLSRNLSSASQQGERMEITARAVSMSANYLRQGVSPEEFQKKSQPFRCSCSSVSEEGKGEGHHHGQCHCDEILLSQGTQLVSLYCESVATHSVERIAAVVVGSVESRSTSSNRKDLLRAIFYDPSNLSSWTALVGVMYADGVLGSGVQRQEGQEKGIEASNEEQKELSSAEEKQAPVLPPRSGCFADEESLQICAKISLHLTRHVSSVPNGHGPRPGPLKSLSSLLLHHLATPVTDPPPPGMPLPDGLPSDLNLIIHRARQEFRFRHFPESVSCYREAIVALKALPSSPPLLSLAIQLSYEAAQVLSHHLLLPEEAELLYQQCSSFQQQLPAPSPTPPCGPAPHVAYELLTALAYLHRYLANQSPTSTPTPAADAQRAQEILQGRCLKDTAVALPANVRAVCLAVHGYLWECQGKSKKALSDYAAAREAFAEIDFPFPVPAK
jgi:tetratricopeptide (TPR) repeat protein